MNDQVFLQANKVFTGRLHDNKEKGHDKTKRQLPIDKEDMEKLFQNYFTPGLESGDTKVLLQKVFFDIVYYTGRRGKEGLRDLDKNSFDIKTGSDGLDYIELNFNEKTKRNEGDKNSSGQNALHDDHHIISAQPGNNLCPVESFKTYISKFNKRCDALFQYPSNDKTSVDRKPIGKNTLATMMKETSEDAKLSHTYTNHCIRKTTATALRRQGFDLDEIKNVTKHKNIESLKHYIDAPMYQDKRNYNEALLNYAEKHELEPKHKKTKLQKVANKMSKNKEIQQPKTDAVAPVMAQSDNVLPENCLVPMYPPEDSQDSIENCAAVPMQNQNNNVVNNQLKTASHLFQNATFNNCNFTFEMPK